MRVYTFRADVNKYRGIYYTTDEDVLEFIRRFNGSPFKANWAGKEKFTFVPARLPKGDTPGLSTHIPVFNTKALEVLADFLRPNGELLPITCDGEKLFIFNVTRVVNALDEANSVIKRFDSGKITDVYEFSFFQERLHGTTVFKITPLVLMDVFVTEPFVERVQETKLKGFKFRQVWSSD